MGHLSIICIGLYRFVLVPYQHILSLVTPPCARTSTRGFFCTKCGPFQQNTGPFNKLLMFYRIINQLVDISSVSHLKKTIHSSRRHDCCYQQLPTRIEAYANSFFPSTIKLWNNLEQRQVNAITIEEFAETLKL